MARKQALLNLRTRLLERRNELLKSISGELGDLRHDRGARTGGDDVDAAVDSASAELTSQLAQHESREVAQIDRALARLRDGTYGSCEMCGKKIAVARLNALPYTPLCIDCQRESETNPNFGEEMQSAGWQKLYETESSRQDISVNLSDIEYKLS
ncbi:MAG: TraR/DksA family transcriptional regulator [Planctomycetota bacterium]